MRHAALALALTAALPLLAQQPSQFRGATITTVRAAGDLRRQIVSLDSANERVWAGYTIPAQHTRHVEICCSECCNGSCSLDGDHMSITTNSAEELTSDVSILYRVKDGAIASIRAFSSCGVNATGAHIYWIEGVDPRASMALLDSLAKGDDLVVHKAIFALSLHDGATDLLIELAHHAERSKVRSQALFWLAQSAADKAAGALRESVDNDPDEEVRSKAVFGISQLPNDQSIPLLVELMRTHRSRAVRKKAAFWLGQKNDPRALDAIESFLRQ